MEGCWSVAAEALLGGLVKGPAPADWHRDAPASSAYSTSRNATTARKEGDAFFPFDSDDVETVAVWPRQLIDRGRRPPCDAYQDGARCMGSFVYLSRNSATDCDIEFGWLAGLGSDPPSLVSMLRSNH
jgi:hypothetical protein